jgi:hypothetical protein
MERGSEQMPTINDRLTVELHLDADQFKRELDAVLNKAKAKSLATMFGAPENPSPEMIEAGAEVLLTREKHNFDFCPSDASYLAELVLRAALPLS